MRRAPRRLERGRARGGPVLLAALAGFALICGLVILVVGGPSRKPKIKDTAPKQMELVNKQIRKAIHSMHQAEGALNAANYGAIRGHLQRGRESLAVVQYQLKEVKKARQKDNGAKSKK